MVDRSRKHNQITKISDHVGRKVRRVFFVSNGMICSLTRSFFFLSGVMKPFFAFLAFEASSIRLRTSARLRSISACLAFFAYWKFLGKKRFYSFDEKRMTFAN